MPRRYLLLAVAATAGIAIAQSPGDPHPLTFAVASIKPAAAAGNVEGGHRARIEHTPSSLTLWNVAITDCVQWAYDVAFFQLSGGHLGPVAYNIAAKTDAPASVGQLRTMLQNLLATRFKLTLHRESRMLPVYELVVAKGGPKLPAANAGGPQPAVHAAESLPRIRNDSFVFSDVSMAEFAQVLTQLRGIDLPVVDRTGIAGNFDIVLKSAPSATRDGDSDALFAIIQEQLGLRLAAAKAPIDVLVIDHVEKPSEN